jgi:hypothetical protein
MLRGDLWAGGKYKVGIPRFESAVHPSIIVSRGKVGPEVQKIDLRGRKGP